MEIGKGTAAGLFAPREPLQLCNNANLKRIVTTLDADNSTGYNGGESGLWEIIVCVTNTPEAAFSPLENHMK